MNADKFGNIVFFRFGFKSAFICVYLRFHSGFAFYISF